MLIHEDDDPSHPQVTHNSQLGLLDDPDSHNLKSDLSFVNEMILNSNDQRISDDARRPLQLQGSVALSVKSDALDSPSVSIPSMRVGGGNVRNVKFE